MNEISYFPSAVSIPYYNSVEYIGGVKVGKGTSFLKSAYDHGAWWDDGKSARENATVYVSLDIAQITIQQANERDDKLSEYKILREEQERLNPTPPEPVQIERKSLLEKLRFW
jgi:hypothetical protein